MGTDIEIFRQMVELSSIVEVRQKNNKRTLTLSEKNTCSVIPYSVKIVDPPPKCIAIKSDHFEASQAFFQRRKGVLCRSDYILIAHQKTKYCVVFIELKSGKGNRSKIIQQLKGSQCLLDYCRSIGRRKFNCRNFLELSKYQQRFVNIQFAQSANQRSELSKQPQSQQKLHDSPENMLTLVGSNQQFNKLLR